MFGEIEMAAGRIANRRAATRSAILDAAWELAHERGLAQIGMRELAAKLGMAASSLYEYFSGKHAIYDAMFVQGNEALRDEFKSLIVADQGSVREALIAGARRFVEFCDTDHAHFRLLFQSAIPGWQPSSEACEVAVANLGEMRSYLSGLGIDDDDSADW